MGCRLEWGSWKAETAVIVFGGALIRYELEQEKPGAGSEEPEYAPKMRFWLLASGSAFLVLFSSSCSCLQCPPDHRRLISDGSLVHNLDSPIWTVGFPVWQSRAMSFRLSNPVGISSASALRAEFQMEVDRPEFFCGFAIMVDGGRGDLSLSTKTTNRRR